jgi:hypothetical protein
MTGPHINSCVDITAGIILKGMWRNEMQINAKVK